MLVTSALPYVNNVPHLGNIIGCVLSADAYARWARARGHTTLFVCGTDEYGTATETKALEEGTTPGAVCDKYHSIHAATYAWFRISTDAFGRTPTFHQTAIAQSLFRAAGDAGMLVENTVDQLYSEAAGTFLADRFVIGKCPKCSADGARGDQCDACGALLTPTELIDARCSITGTVPVLRSTRHVFLDLPQLEADLASYHASASAHGGWTSNCVATTAAWMRDGLKQRCITRDLRWGTPVPRAGFEDKVFYVWFDAPIGYISITATASPSGWARWWRPEPGADVELIQFMGKDNVPFHTVIFPATLLAANRVAAVDAASESAGDATAASTTTTTTSAGIPPRDGGGATSRPWALMKSISVTEYLTYEGGKFSKSRGVGVFGDGAAAAGLDADVWRYYLLAVRPESADTDFKWADLAARNNAELLANFGNFVHRALTFATSKLGGVVPPPPPPGTAAAAAVADLTSRVAPLLAAYVEAMEGARLRDGVRAWMGASAAGNKFLQDSAPWAVLKAAGGGEAAAGGLLRGALGLAALLAAMAAPFCPGAADALRAQLGLPPFTKRDTPLALGAVEAASADICSLLETGAALGTPETLFRSITKDEEVELRARFGRGDEGESAPAAAGAAGGVPAPAGGKPAKKDGKKKEKPAAAPATPPDVSRLDLRVGRVLSARKHPDADSLYVEEIDVGEGAPRTVCSGLVGKVGLETLSTASVVCVCNLKPVAMRGVESQAMVLAASSVDGGTVELVAPPAGAAPGARVGAAGFEGPPDAEINLKKKNSAWATIQPDLGTTADRVVVYKGVPLTVGGEACVAPSVAGGTVG